MKNLIAILLIPICFNSCLIHVVNDNALDTIDENLKARITKLNSFEATDLLHIFEITGTQLMSELKNHEQSLVYTFANDCSSENCVPISVVETFADLNNMKLFLIMINYKNLEETLIQSPKRPLYSINSEAYNLEKSNKYMIAFKSDIGYYTYPTAEKYPGSYIFFKKDSIVEIRHNLHSK